MGKTSIVVGREAYTGKTKTECTKKALDHLAQFMDGEGFDPIVVVASSADHPGGRNIGVVYRDGNGYWSYGIRWADMTDGKGRIRAINSGAWTRHEAERRLRYHLAQAQYVPLANQSLNECLILLLGDMHEEDELTKDFRRWTAFQDSYATAIACGKSKDEACNIAGRES